MKKARIITLLLAIAAALSIAAFAAEPKWYFNDDKDVSQWKPGGLTVELEEGVYVFIPNSADPTLTVSIPYDRQFSADEYRYIAFRMKAVTEVEIGGFFFGTSVNPGPAGPEFSQFDIVPNEWHGYIVDMKSYDHGKWTGLVDTIRIDPVNYPNPRGEFAAEDRLYIDR